MEMLAMQIIQFLSFEQKGLKHQQRRGCLALERSHFILQPPA